MRDEFTNAYLFHRRNMRARPAVAIQRARDDMDAGKRRYPKRARPGTVCNPEFSAHGYDHVRWIECEEGAGLRFVGYADELTSLRHQGWFADAFQENTYRGAVWQIPARGRVPLFVYGYRDPENKGAALVCFDMVRGDGNGTAWDRDDGAREAARMADGMAEEFAEQEREFSEAWQQAREWLDLGEEAARLREEARELVREMRQAIRAGQTATAAICRALRQRVRALIEEAGEAREQRARLDDEFSYWPGDGKPRLSIAEFAASHF